MSSAPEDQYFLTSFCCLRRASQMASRSWMLFGSWPVYRAAYQILVRHSPQVPILSASDSSNRMPAPSFSASDLEILLVL